MPYHSRRHPITKETQIAKTNEAHTIFKKKQKTTKTPKKRNYKKALKKSGNFVTLNCPSST